MDDTNEGGRLGEIEAVERELNILYEMLVETGERNSVVNIRKACEALASSGCARLTAAAVGRYCEQNFEGPKPQSISNKQKTLAAYVKKWDHLHQLRRGKRSRSKRQDRVQISDPSVAAYVRVVEVERDDAIRARDRLLQAFRRLEPLQFANGSTDAAPDNGVSISEIERDSLRAFLAPDNLARFGLSYDEKSRILDGRRVVMESPLVRLLLRLAGPELKRLTGAA